MNPKILKRLIKKAINNEPPQTIKDYCGIYYSPYYYLFYLLTAHIKQGLFVELGTETGRGSFSAAMGSEFVQVFGIDNQRREKLDHIINTVKNFTFVYGASIPVNGRFGHQSIDVLHIDTEHSHAMAQAEFEQYQPYLKSGAVVCFDDLHAKNDEVLNYFNSLDYWKMQSDELHPTCGYGVLIYGRD